MKVFGVERDYIIHDDTKVCGFFGEDAYRWLSNYHECKIRFKGMKFTSSEAAYQAAKYVDPEIKKQFIGITGAQAKKLAKSLEITTPNWHEIKYEVMSSIIFDKFLRNKDIREKLLQTGNKYLEETNHWGDVYWGICNGKGQNNMGRILMGVREFWKYKTADLKKQYELKL